MSTNPTFQTHLLNEEGKKNAQNIGATFDKLLNELTDLHGCSMNTREFALARTHLEIACFYAKKSMAQRPPMQEGYVP